MDYEEIIDYLKSTPFETTLFSNFVETGTWNGDTTYKMKSKFDNVYTIELSDHYYSRALTLFKEDVNVSIIHGDSTEKILDVIKTSKGKTIFFLDGHWSNGDTSKGKKDCPLLEELEIINNNNKDETLIIIDDYHLFGTNQNENWSDITLKNTLEKVNERLFLYKEEKFRLILFLNSKIL